MNPRKATLPSDANIYLKCVVDLSCVNQTATISSNSNKSQKDNTNRTDFENNSNKNSILCEIFKFAGINIVRQE